MKKFFLFVSILFSVTGFLGFFITKARAEAIGIILNNGGSSSVRVSSTPADAQGHQQVRIHQSETRFFFQNLESPALHRAYKVLFTRDWTVGDTTPSGSVRVEAYDLQSNDPSQKLYEVQEQGTEFLMPTQSLFQIGGSASSNHLYHSRDGSKLADLEGEHAFVFETIPNAAHPRYFGFSKEIFNSKKPSEAGKQYLGTVFYFSLQRILDRVRIFGNTAKEDPTLVSKIRINKVQPLLSLGDQHFPGSFPGFDRITLAPRGTLSPGALPYDGIGITAQFELGTQQESLLVRVSGDRIDARESKASPNLELRFGN